MMNSYKKLFVDFWNNKANQIIAIGTVVIIAVGVFCQLSVGEPKPSAAHEPDFPDTIIPAGYVLAPVELENADSLASLVGQFGIVDLYGGSKSKRRKIGTRLRILRAPLNPKAYAVMVRESEAPKIVTAGPLVAVLQNSLQKSGGIIESSPGAPSATYYQGSP